MKRSSQYTKKRTRKNLSKCKPQVSTGWFDYKDKDTLCKFLSEDGKILPIASTSLTLRMQRKLAKAVKRARYLAILPYTCRHSLAPYVG